MMIEISHKNGTLTERMDRTSAGISVEKLMIEENQDVLTVVQECVENQFTHSSETPSTMNEKKASKAFETFDGEITRSNGLRSFTPIDGDTTMRFTNHTNIISTVTDSQDPMTKDRFRNSGQFTFLRS